MSGSYEIGVTSCKNGRRETRGRRLAAALLGWWLCTGCGYALTYDEWMAGYPQITGAAAEMGADPDGDGVENLMEFALADGNPTLGNGTLTGCVIGRRAENGLPAKVIGAIVPLGVGEAPPEPWHIGISFRPRVGATGIRYVPELSPMPENIALRQWFGGRNAVVIRLGRTDGEMIGWGLQAMSKSHATRAFMRLRVITID